MCGYDMIKGLCSKRIRMLCFRCIACFNMSILVLVPFFYSCAMVVRTMYIYIYFRRLRERFQVDPADYMLAICGSDALRELSSPGKSGSCFYLTQDDRFMIKTVRKSEVKVGCHSLLTRLVNFENLPELSYKCFDRLC